MDYLATREYPNQKPHVQEDFPFGEDVLVMKVKGQMFATLFLEHGQMRINLKCAPHEALLPKDPFSAVLTGSHMHKKHWNRINLGSGIPPGEIRRMIDNSFKLVVNKLSKEEQTSYFSRESIFCDPYVKI